MSRTLLSSTCLCIRFPPCSHRYNHNTPNFQESGTRISVSEKTPPTYSNTCSTDFTENWEFTVRSGSQEISLVNLFEVFCQRGSTTNPALPLPQKLSFHERSFPEALSRKLAHTPFNIPRVADLLHRFS